MKFAIVIHKDPESDFGVIIPDFPGCHSSGTTIDEACVNAIEAIGLWVATALEHGTPIPTTATRIDTLVCNTNFKGAAWTLVDVDLEKLMMEGVKRVNVSFTTERLNRIDAFVKKINETRSGFLARAALAAIEAEERKPLKEDDHD